MENLFSRPSNKLRLTTNQKIAAVAVAGKVGGLSGLTAGSRYYVNQVGSLTTDGKGAQALGVAISSTELLVQPGIGLPAAVEPTPPSTPSQPTIESSNPSSPAEPTPTPTEVPAEVPAEPTPTPTPTVTPAL